jgi:hypothetical protein
VLRREIMQAPPGFTVEHRNGDQLDLRRENLVMVSPSERAARRLVRIQQAGPTISNTSGFRGVSWDGRRQTWTARLRINGKLFNLGRFSTAEAAARAWDQAAREAWGEAAYQNLAVSESEA